jgi:uncharacterized metal-binding protein
MAAIVLAVIAYFVGLGWGLSFILGASELLGGYFLSPDLDTISSAYRRWGWLRWWWIPYRRMFYHRSFWTHAPIFGTFFRLVWLFPLWLPFLFYFDPIYAVAVVVGIEVSAIVHWVVDLIT